jgi:hypothetical protein
MEAASMTEAIDTAPNNERRTQVRDTQTDNFTKPKIYFFLEGKAIVMVVLMCALVSMV